MNKTIKIGHPRVELASETARLIADIEYLGEMRQVWFEVEKKYAKYLCFERSDAFLIGLLSFAMRHGSDIICEAPVSEDLLYQIRTYLVPSLVKYGRALYATKIDAQPDVNALPNAGGVGTGLSCGVDSMHAVAMHIDSPYPRHKITHLTIFNVGAFYKGKDDPQHLWQVNHAREMCKEYGYELIVTDSNLADAFEQNHLLTHTYSSCFAIYCMQKLWSVYYYGSAGADFMVFSLRDNDIHDAAYYELLSLDVFSTRNLKIYSEGGAQTRFEKTRDLISFEPSHKYLHVCGNESGPNCMKCDKCERTLVALDALGALDLYQGAFNIDYYKKHRGHYLRWVFRQQIAKHGDYMVREPYEILKPEIRWYWMLAEILAEGYDRTLAPYWMKTKHLLIKLSPKLYHWYLRNVKKSV